MVSYTLKNEEWVTIMKDLKNLAIFGGITGAVILLLVSMAASDRISDTTVGYLSILLVVILPIILSIRMIKNEKKQ